MGHPISMDLEQNATAGTCSETVNPSTLQVLAHFAEVGQEYFDRTGESSTNLAEIEAWQLLGRPENPAGHHWDSRGVCQFCDEVKSDMHSKWCPWNQSN